MNTPDRKKLMNEPLENTPGQMKKWKKLFKEEESSSKRLKPIEKGDMSPPSLATDKDFEEVARDMRSPVQDELAEIGKGREIIEKVEGMPGIQSKSDKKMQDIIVEQKPSDNTGGGILEMFGLAGGRRRRRKSRRKKRRKSRRKRRKRTKKKRKRKSRRRRSRRRRR